jgi:hypothetical protein
VANDLETVIAAGTVTALQASRTSDRPRAARDGRVRQDARRVHPNWRGGDRRSADAHAGSAGSGNGGQAMSTMKSPDDAILPEPSVSPGRELRLQEGRRSKMAAKAQSRSAPQAKENNMPKKPKSEPNATEPRKPGEMTPSSSDRKEAGSPTQKRGRGRMPGFRMPEEHRTKIQNSRILRVLIDHVEGREEISPARVTAALGLLKKVLPDLQAVTIGGDPANPLRHEHAIDFSSMSDDDLAELLRGGARCIAI